MIDWELVLDTAVDAGAVAAKDYAPQVREALRAIRRQNEAALKEIGLAYIDGDIDRDTFESSLRDEAETLKNELLAVTVLTKVIAQRALNAFRDALIDGIGKAVAVAI